MEAEILAYMDEEIGITDKFKALRLRSGLSMDKLAAALGYKGRSSIQRYEDPTMFTKQELPAKLVRGLINALEGKGDPPISKQEITELGGVLFTESDVTRVRVKALPVLGVVAAGVWIESDFAVEKFEPAPIMLDPEYPTEAQFGLMVRGTSLSKIASEGDVLICIGVGQAKIDPKEGDLVVVRRIRHQGQMIETTAKRLRKNGDFELWPESNDPTHQEPLIVPDSHDSDDEVVQVMAVVTGIYRPLKRPR